MTLSRRLSFFGWLILPSLFSGVAGPLRAQGPVAVDDDVVTDLIPGLHLMVDVTANDSHGDGAAVLVSSVTQPAVGQVTVNPDNTLSYLLGNPQGLSRVDFQYTVVDSRQRPSTARVCIGQCLQHISVVCRPDAYTVQTGQQVTLPVLDNDDGEDLQILRVLPVSHQDNPLVSADGQGLVYTAAATAGSDDFLYEVTAAGTNETFSGSVHVDIVAEGPGGGGVRMGEAGRVILEGSPTGIPNPPQFVPFANTYQRPVVIARPATRNGPLEVVPRISSVTAGGFWIYLSEPPVGDLTHELDEEVSYVVVEAGRWRLPGSNVMVEAHSLESNAVSQNPQHFSDQVRFSEDFASSPLVLTQVQSAVNPFQGRPAWMHTRHAQVAASGFAVALERDAVGATTPLALEEEIGWLALQRSQGGWGQLEYVAHVVGGNVCPPGWLSCELPYGATFSQAPLLMANLHTVFGAPGHLRLGGAGTSSAVVTFEDNSLGGPAPQHPGGDWVGFLALSASGDLFGERLNRPPTAFDQTVVCTTGGSVSFAASATDPDGDPLWIDELDGAPPELSHDGQVFTYAPAGGCSGSVSFRHKVRDRAVEGFRSHWAEVTVAYSNTTQVEASDDSHLERSELVTFRDQQLDIHQSVVFANDVPANELFLAAVTETPQTHGTVTVSNQAPYAVVHYQPDPGYVGEAAFIYTAILDTASPPYPEDSALVTVNVLPVNYPPEAVADAAAVQRGVRFDLDVLANDSDPDGQALRVVSVTSPSHGLVEINGDGTLRYTAAADYFGADAFSYTVTDDDPEDPLTDTAEITLTVSRDLLYDAFTNASPDREPGDSLVGTPPEEGAGAWSGWQVEFGSGTVTSNGGGTTAFAGLPLPSVPLSQSSTYVVEGHLALGTGNWAALGFSQQPGQSFWNEGSLWLSLHRAQLGGEPAAGLYLRGVGGAVLASAVVSQFDPAGPNLLRLEYDRATQRASLWVNGRRAVHGFQLSGSPPKLGAAGFQLSYPAGTPAGSMGVDDFSVRMRPGPSVPAALISEGFFNKGFDRQNGRKVHRVTSEEGDARLWAENLRFGTVVAKVVPEAGARETRGLAMVPFVPDNFPPVEGVTAPVETQARLRVGDATGAWLGFLYGFAPQGFTVASELAVKLEPDGRWELFGPARLGKNGLVDGILPGFDPNVYVVVRLRLSADGVSLWFGANQVLDDFSPFVPIDPDPRWAGFEVVVEGSTSTASVDSFNVSSEGGTP